MVGVRTRWGKVRKRCSRLKVKWAWLSAQRQERAGVAVEEARIQPRWPRFEPDRAGARTSNGNNSEERGVTMNREQLTQMVVEARRIQEESHMLFQEITQNMENPNADNIVLLDLMRSLSTNIDYVNDLGTKISGSLRYLFPDWKPEDATGPSASGSDDPAVP
ncbi:hypothetical protein EJB05_42910 [Eragrostis curvula]|uniref:Uncharacterized protein n=1 Tax=Eragrostis curvula TaxID=38414 RepID=A0A5J9TEL9_9POAL|nr:hypothetical protein EJB05_42910 [Eragrostis curvula]